jgi:hypothetical protein
MIERPSNPATMERLRALCLSHDGVTEKLSHGEPTWFTRRKKSFAMSADHHHDDRVAVWCAAPSGVQAELVETEPERFFRPPYVGGRGWIGVYLDVPDLDWDELGEIIAEAHRTIDTPRPRP